MAASDSTTVSFVLTKYRLKEEDVKRQITDLHIDEISRSFCKKWRSLPAQFKMEPIVVNDINRKPGDEDEKRRDFLLQWREEKGSRATYKVLISALLNIKCENEAEGVCKLVSSSGIAKYIHCLELILTASYQVV